MSVNFFKTLGVTCGLIVAAFLLVVGAYAVRAWTVPKPIAVRYVPPVPEEPPDDPNLSDEDKRMLELHRATIQTAKKEIIGLRGEISATGGHVETLKAIDTEIADWERKKKVAEDEIARIRAGETAK